MRWLLTTVFLLASLTPALAEDRLPARPIDVPFAVVPDHGPWDFDLIDFREGEKLPRGPTATRGRTAHVLQHQASSRHRRRLRQRHRPRQRRLLSHRRGMGALELRRAINRDWRGPLSGAR